MIEIKNNSKIHGKGVFSKSYLSAGITLTCDVITLSEIPKELEKYTFGYEHPIECLCMGFGNFFNHSKEPNTKILKLNKGELTMDFITLKEINQGEELTIFYDENFENNLNNKK